MRVLDRRLLRYGEASRPFLLLSVVLGLATAACVLAQALILAGTISAVFVGGADFSAIAGQLVLLAGVTLARAVLAHWQEAAGARASAAVKSQLRGALIRRAVTDGTGGLRTGELAQLATRGIDALDPYFARYLPQVVLTGIVTPLFLIAVWVTDWLSGLVILVTVPVVVLFMVVAGLAARRTTDRQWRVLNRLANHFIDIVDGLATLRVFGRARAQQDTVATVTDDYRRATMGVLRVAFISSFVLELFTSLSVAIVAVQIGLRLIAGDVGLSVALVVLLLAPEAFAPLRQLGANHHAATEGVSAAAQILDVIDAPVPRGGTAVVPGAAGVAVERVTVRRADGQTTLAPVSFQLQPGEVVALVGPSGAGKSTLVDVLLGFLEPSTGGVRVGGVALADADHHRWREHVAWLPQRPTLLDGTVADNVRLGAPDASDGDVIAALTSAACDGISPTRRLVENGADLSMGERQRIALARCFLRAARGATLVLLDEPTAHLDTVTEARVLTAIRDLAAGRCVLMVAHRAAAVDAADRTVDVGPRDRSPVPT
ncbi:thiol reductant ABC exporter subunit CydD [Mycolicibacterium sp.]|uniref:thiol reductant ABC exporter subunit CydD n=1 Tax=Mycolicibacterium sp. TaxID=2320850 RepID=UPI0037C9ED79